MANFFNFIELKYDELSSQINDWLKYVYSKSSISLNASSPYGQIIMVLKELFQHNIIYLKNAIKILDITTTRNKKVAIGTARIAGYSPGRAISATGTLKFILKQGIDISKEIKDSTLSIKNGLRMKNNTNSLKYSVNINTEEMIYSLTNSNNSFFVPIIQGVREKQSFTGDGTANQSFSVNIQSHKQVENFNYTITYNGIDVNKKDRMYDMIAGEYECVVKSGFNGGIDIYFGNSNFGFIPVIGSTIQVTYLLSDGASGEILNPIANDFKIEGDITDGQGNILNSDKLFDILIESDINFASDGDTLEFIKMALPNVSRNFVLGTPEQFIFHLKKLNMFSKVNAYNKLDDNNYSVSEKVVEDAMKKLNYDINNNSAKSQLINDINKFNEIYSKYKTNLNDNEIYLYLIPSITKYFNGTINYFNVPYDVFSLDDNEKNKIIQYLRQMGTLSMTTEINIIQPYISKYTMHVYVRRFDDAIEENIRQEIIAKSSDYLLNNSRYDRIPKSDFIKMFKDIDGVDSTSVFFISKKNEDYHRTSSEQLNNYNENIIKGIDKVHGDIIIERDEYVVIRGGWRDRNGVWYNEDMSDNSLNSINIVFNGVTQK